MFRALSFPRGDVSSVKFLSEMSLRRHLMFKRFILVVLLEGGWQEQAGGMGRILSGVR